MWLDGLVKVNENDHVSHILLSFQFHEMLVMVVLLVHVFFALAWHRRRHWLVWQMYFFFPDASAQYERRVSCSGGDRHS